MRSTATRTRRWVETNGGAAEALNRYDRIQEKASRQALRSGSAQVSEGGDAHLRGARPGTNPATGTGRTSKEAVMSTTTTEAKPRALAKGVKNEVENSTIVQAKGSVQSHILVDGAKSTLCGINVSNWKEQAEVADDAKVTCPVCAERQKTMQAEAKKAAKEAEQAAAQDEAAAEAEAQA